MSEDKSFSLSRSEDLGDNKKKKKEKKTKEESNPNASPEIDKTKKEKKKKHVSKERDEKYSNIGILLTASPSKENVSSTGERRNSQSSSSPKVLREPKSPVQERRFTISLSPKAGRERRKSNAASSAPKSELEQEALQKKYYSGDFGDIVKVASEGAIHEEEIVVPVQEKKKTLKEKLGIKFPTLTRSKSHSKADEEAKKPKEKEIQTPNPVYAPTSPTLLSSRRTTSGRFSKLTHSNVDKAIVKLANEILENWEYSVKPDKSKIMDVIVGLFVRMRELTGQLSLPESEFIRLFEGRLGPDRVVKRIFMYLDSSNEGALDPKQFWNGLGLLDAGTEDEKLKLLFYAYDEDDSGALEPNEIDSLLEQAHDRLVSIQNLSKEEADTYISIVRGKLDPSNEGVRRDNFIERSLSLPNFVGALIPPNLLRIDIAQWTNVFRNIEDSIDLSENTHELLTLLRANRDEDTHRIKTLIKDHESFGVDLNAQDHFGYTAIHYAITKDKDMFVTMLLQNRVDVKKKYKGGMTVLHAAAEKGKEKSLKILLDNGAEVNARDESGQTPLHYCMKAEKAEVGGGIDNCIIELIRWEADLNIADKDGCTVLGIAARYGQPEYIELLVEKGCNIQHLSKGNFTPLHWAAHNSSVMCVKKLLGLGADPNARTSSDATALHLAAESGSLNCIELLIEAKAEVYALDKKKRTPLHMAAANGNIRCVKFLIKHSPEALKIKDVEGDTPKHTAQKRNNREAAKIISDGPIQEQSEEVKLLLKTFREGDADTVMELMKKPNIDIHAANENGTSLLHYAAMQGREDIITLLIDRGVDPNIGNNRHTTPLHKAAQRGELKCLIALLQSGADINAQDDDGVTPLHRAIRELGKGGAQPGVIKCINELINNKAKLNLSDKDGCFPLDLAARYGLTELVGPLVEAGGDIHHKSKNGYEPVHWAAANGRPQTIKELVQSGASINIINTSSEAEHIILPLNLAIQNNQIEAVEMLKKLKADMTLADSSERTPLHEAASSKNLRLFTLIVESIESKGPDNFVRKDKEGNTPLHEASLPEIVEQLIQYGGNIHAENKIEETPLLVASSRGNTQVVESLINQKSDFTKVNKFGQNALYLAAKGGYTDCVEYLKTIGLKFTEQTDSTIKYEITAEAVYPVVKAATLERLIEHLVYNKYADEKFMHTFFTVFRKYMSPHDLLEKLLNMLHVHRPTVHKNTLLFSSATKDEPHSTSQLKLADSKVTDLNSVRLPPGAAYTISFWIKHYFNDFDDRGLADMFLEHMRTQRVSLGHIGRYLDIVFSDKFEESVKGKSTEHHLTRTHSFNAGMTQAVRVDQTDAKIMAQQMTLIESKLFSSIDYQEFLFQNWTKHHEKAPNILAMIKHFNQVSSWMVTEIVTLEKKADRVKLIKKLTRIANYCYEMHNFQTVMQVISALENAAVARLKKTWQDVGAKAKNILATLKTRMSQERNYKNYRALLCSLTGPCVPFLGITLSDLTFTDENPEFVQEEGIQLINFDKYMLIHQIISDILRHQQTPYTGFESNQSIASYLYNIVAINDKQAFERSLKIEPRDKN